MADLGWGLPAGLAGTVGGAALNRGLAVGRMGVVAPVSAVLAAALPALFGMFMEGLPGTRTFIGFSLEDGVFAVGRDPFGPPYTAHGALDFGILCRQGVACLLVIVAKTAQAAVDG